MFVAINVVPKVITFKEVQEKTLKDEVLQQVAIAIERNKWDHLLDKKSPDNNAFKSFYKVRSELTIARDRSYVLRGTRLVMLFTTQTRAIDLAHEGHQGLVKSKQLIRTKAWLSSSDETSAASLSTSDSTVFDLVVSGSSSSKLSSTSSSSSASDEELGCLYSSSLFSGGSEYTWTVLQETHKGSLKVWRLIDVFGFCVPSSGIPRYPYHR